MGHPNRRSEPSGGEDREPLGAGRGDDYCGFPFVYLLAVDGAEQD